jgi:hypothetical protein
VGSEKKKKKRSSMEKEWGADGKEEGGNENENSKAGSEVLYAW